MRIEVGYGLEERLTDARSRHILDNIVRPHFRNGNFGAGIQAGVNAILATIEGAPLPAPPPAKSNQFGSIVGLIVFGDLHSGDRHLLLVALVARVMAGSYLPGAFAAFPAAMFRQPAASSQQGRSSSSIVRTFLPLRQGVPASRMMASRARCGGRWRATWLRRWGGMARAAAAARVESPSSW
jgi:uncharacterized protein